MEEGGGLTFKYGVLDRSTPHLIRPTPPLTAIERFLWGTNNFKQKQIQASVDRGVQNGLCEFSAYNGGMEVLTSGFSLPTLQDFSFVDEWITDGESVSERKDEKNSREGEKKVKSSSSTNLIKGQWTDEEDRLLVKLVKEYGVRKWAQIAQKMVGRAGKQCRERWHNHLRPDIKKDTWSEEEERLLVEAHEKIGNKWAEIAKTIPGRSENAIKNHWNATKRRQNSSRKNKKAASHLSGKPEPSILQDYIRSKSMVNDTSTLIPTPSISSPTIASSSSTNPSNQFSFVQSEPSSYSLTDVSSTLMADSYEDESHFMENFFENILKDPLDGTVVISKVDEAYHNMYIPHAALPNVTKLNMFNSSHLNTEMSNNGYSTVPSPTNKRIRRNNTTTSHMSSDLYLSYLLDGANSVSPNNHCSENLNFNQDQASSTGKKDMDLIEMVFLQGRKI